MPISATIFSYSWITSTALLDAMIADWKQRGIVTIAVDFEGEFNLHIYGEHLCLVQIFDGEKFYLIDPFKVDKEALQRLFETPKLEKLWFACSSDASLLWKKYQVRLLNVYDIAIEAAILGIEGNLASLETLCRLTEPENGTKKKNQKSNWLLRPLPEEQIQYALSDVAYLFSIRNILDQKAIELGKQKEICNAMKSAATVKENAEPGYTKLPGYRRMTIEQKIRAKYLFIARDTLAKENNRPPFQILDKHIISELAERFPSTEEQLSRRITSRNYSMKRQLISLLMNAEQKAQNEIGGKNEG